MSIPFYAKSETNQGYIKNMEVLGYHDLNGVMAFQMALNKTAPAAQPDPSPRGFPGC